LAKHGDDIETLNVWAFEEISECEAFAKEFSQKNNIVESHQWANLKNENGKDGGFSGYRWYTDGTIDKLCLFPPGDNWKSGRKHQKSITKGYRWYNNGKINISSPEKPAGNQWVAGMLPKNLPSIKNKTHNFFDPSHRQRLIDHNRNLMSKGLHSSQAKWTCKTCGRSGQGLSNYSRWHGNNCRKK